MIFIYGNVPSSKNSKRWTGRFLISNEATQKYKKYSAKEYETFAFDFVKEVVDNHIPVPLKVGFHFVRKSKHKFDFINACQVVQDLMVRHGWIPDDNMDELLPFPLEVEGSYYSYDKTNPGVFIKLL